MMIKNSSPGRAKNTPPPAILKQVTDSAVNPLNVRERRLYIFMHINALLQRNLTGELIKFCFFKTTVTFRRLNPVLTLLACVNNNDVEESQHCAPRHKPPNEDVCWHFHSGKSVQTQRGVGGTGGGGLLICMKISKHILILK